MSSLVTCAECRHFTRDKIGFGDGIGRCGLFEEWLNKFPRRRPKSRDYDKAFRYLGDKVFYPDIERNCSKYIDDLSKALPSATPQSGSNYPGSF